MYGTLRSEIGRVLGAGKHVVMDIDVQGAQQLTRVFRQSVTIFVLPPSAEVLLDRLRQRQTESTAQLAKRLHSALQELQAVELYQYIVTNDDLVARRLRSLRAAYPRQLPDAPPYQKRRARFHDCLLLWISCRLLK